MKSTLICIALLFSASATALTVEECKRLAAFQANQQAKLSLSRYGLGLITAEKLEAEQEAQRQWMFAEWALCERPK